MIFSYSSLSEPGPRPVNEDAVGIWAQSDGRLFVAVADGLGGMGGGAIASNLAIELLSRFVSEGRSLPDDFLSIFAEINSEIIERQDDHPANSTMATTLSLVLLDGRKLWGAHCGDTRVMISRGNGIKRLSRDHSEAQRFLEQGKLTRQEYLEYPRKNVLYSALGGKKPLEVQTFEFDIASGDWVLLTSDGVHQIVSTGELRDVALGASSPDDYLSRLREILAEKELGDNYSAVVVRAD